MLHYRLNRFRNKSLQTFVLIKKMVQTGVSCSRAIATTYEDAVVALNGLQSNAAYLRDVKKHDPKCNDTLEKTRKYFLRSGGSLEQLDRLSVIHVAGTKGKGSTCAFTESILQAHGFKTGLYTSPHLISVRERFRINGKPIDKDKFTKYFWKLYKILEVEREYENDMPPYFQFLTLLMFHIFMNEPIDVAIVEVGIGGEYDCTNIVRNPVCVGITSLGLDHTNLLGNTLTDIAFQKSGIFKNGTIAFTVPQASEAKRVLEIRAIEKNCSLNIVSPLKNYPWTKREAPKLGISGAFQSNNASLAINLAATWFHKTLRYKQNSFSFDSVALALTRCKWPGRTQVLRGKTTDFYLDGAHTLESIECCAKWFAESTKASTGKRVLIFNTTGNRKSAELLDILRPLYFDEAYFVPNIAGDSTTVDQINYTVTSEEQMQRCHQHRKIWGERGICASNVFQGLNLAIDQKNSSSGRIQLLVTGSLHLVGAALANLDPDLTMSTKF